MIYTIFILISTAFTPTQCGVDALDYENIVNIAATECKYAKFSKSKKRPMAIGILQQWPIYEKMYNTVRTDPVSAADTWMKHIVKMLPKVTKQCRYKSEKRKWIAAWVTGIRYKKKGGRCKEKPKHLRLLNKWHRSAKNISCEDGC